jgi:hypothetical protein
VELLELEALLVEEELEELVVELELLDELELLEELGCRVKFRVKVGQPFEKLICRMSRRDGQPFPVFPS